MTLKPLETAVRIRIKIVKQEIELVRGSGNVFRDTGHPNAGAAQLKAILAAQIIKAMDERNLTTRAAHKLTGIAAADFSRIRQAKLGRFTIDRLMNVLDGLDCKVEVSVAVSAQEDVGSYDEPRISA